MWQAIDPAWKLAAVAIAAWLWGSFLNQWVDRTPLRAAYPDMSIRVSPGAQAPPVHPTLLHPVRSVCFSCGTGIAWYDNLPILSYMLLRGRCRACAAAIGRRTLIMESATPLAVLAVYLAAQAGAWPVAWQIWAVGAVSLAMVAAPLTIEGRGRPRTRILLAGALTVWAFTLYFF